MLAGVPPAIFQRHIGVLSRSLDAVSSAILPPKFCGLRRRGSGYAKLDPKSANEFIGSTEVGL